MGRITVDARMLEASGIGRYLQELLPRLIDGGGDAFTLLGDPAALARHGLGVHGRGAAVEATSPIYSLREQVEVPARVPADTELFWSPHFNVPLLYRGRLLVTVHDVLHLARPEYVPGPHRRLYARLVYGAAVRKASAVLCVSHFSADELVRLAGASRDRIRVVHLGVADAWLAPEAGERPHSRPYFLVVGNVKPHKNLRRLVAAFQSVADRLPHDLVVVGKREGFLTGDPEVVAQAERLGGRVHFTGFVPDAELRRYVAHAEALALVSTYEGFGLPAVEAMAAGCPVLASRAASLPEVCGDAALYCDPLDVRDIARGLRRLAGEPALREELRERGRERVQRFRWDRCAEETRQVIDSVLAS